MLCANFDYPPKPKRVHWYDDPEARSGVFWGCMVVLMIALAWLAGGCGPCQVAYNFDGQRYYRIEDCGHGPVVTCDSANRLPQPECGADDAPVK